MQDYQIVDLYWQRDEGAIRETASKYEKYLYKITYNVLFDEEDCKETINETYLRAWNSMPTNRPKVLSTYLGKIARQLAIDKFRTKNREKRKASEYALSLEELEDCLTIGNDTEQSVALKELALSIEQYLKSIPKENRVIFIARYYYMDSIKDIAKFMGFSEANTKTILYRTRLGLKEHLKKEGILI